MYPRLLYAVPGAEPGQNQTDRWYDGLRHSFRALQLPRLVGVAAACVIYAAATAPSSHAAADPNKVLRIALEAADDGMDAMRTNSLYTTWLVQNVFENLLRYDHMARPAKLIPNLAEAMPEISDDGKTYTVRIKKGVYFTPDPVFKGQRREVTAEDFIYTLKRVMDPANVSPQSGDYEGKIVGLDEAVQAARKGGKFDYAAPIAGMQALDRYTLRYQLKQPDYNFLFLMADTSSAVVAREVVEHYGSNSGRHPVGTGPYMLKQYVPRSKIVFVANPDYRGQVWQFESDGSEWDERIAREMRGKTLPQIGRVEVSIIDEPQSRWLAFDSGQIDIDLLAESAVPRVLDGNRLKPELAKRGIRLYRFRDPGTTRTYFNFNDPVVGGYSLEKIALRRALMLAYDTNSEIERAAFGQAVKAESDVPEGVVGFDPSYRSSIGYDPVLANKLLDRFGYRKGADGFRTLPDGKPLTVKIHSAPHARDVTKMEVWRNSLKKIGVRGQFPVAGFADNLKAAYLCQLPMFGLGGTASLPDASDFMSAYYGPNQLRGNFGCYQSKQFDEAFARARLLPDNAERRALYHKMTRILEADGARMLQLWRIRNWLIQPRVKGYKKHPVQHGDWMFLDVDRH